MPTMRTIPVKTLKNWLSAGFLACALLSCASSTTTAPENGAADTGADGTASGDAATAPPAAPEPPAPVEYGNFTEEQLYQAIISELGAARGHMEDSAESYFDLAFATRDPSIIRRAVQFASANNNTRALLELGLLWSEIEPDNPQPHLLLAYEFLETGNFDQSISHMARVLDLGEEFDFTALAARTGQLSLGQREQLIESLRNLRDEFATERSIHLTLVQLLAQNQHYEQARQELAALVDQHGDAPGLVRLRAQIEESLGESDLALRSLRDGVREFPDNRTLRFTYARQLVAMENYREARDQFQILVDQDATDWETWYSMALLDMEMENYERAAEVFTRLIGVDQRSDESQYYLAFINEEQGNIEQAIEHYREVRIGTNNYLNAQQQATRLAISIGDLDGAHSWLMSQSRGQPRLEIVFTTVESSLLTQAGHIERARDLLDTALNKYPNETDLLFARVLLNDSVGNRAGSERDLRQIISMQPDDARALNHLGYMLADQTERYEEALELVERAIALSPDDPAIIDSLGWAQYKLGRYEEALQNLRRAYAAFPDHEVASHLGEVLWQMDRQEEAIEVWEQALEERPDSDLIEAVMDRFLPDR